MAPTVQLRPGRSAPWFKAPSGSNPNYSFDTVGGRYVLLAFLGSSQTELVTAGARGGACQPGAVRRRQALLLRRHRGRARSRRGPLPDDGARHPLFLGHRPGGRPPLRRHRRRTPRRSRCPLPLLLAAARPDAAGRGRGAVHRRRQPRRAIIDMLHRLPSVDEPCRHRPVRPGPGAAARVRARVSASG